MLIRYIFKRILMFIPTLFFVSLAIFLLDKYMPGDPVLRGLKEQESISEKIYLDRWKTFNLNYPIFYFTFTSAAVSDTIYNIPNKQHRQVIQALTNQTGNWATTQAYFGAVKSLKKEVLNMPKDSATADKLIAIKIANSDLLRITDDKKITEKLQIIKETIASDTALRPLQTIATTLENTYRDFRNKPTIWKNYIPKLQWHGTNNQYHIWVFGNKPWITKTKNILTVDAKPLTVAGELRTLKAPAKGYYKVIPHIRLSENKGKLSERDIQAKKIFSIDINGISKDYSPNDLAKTEFIIFAKKEEKISIDLKIKPLVNSYQLKYEYKLEANQLLNYHPDRLSKGFIRFDFGKNYQLIPVSDIIKNSIFWTILISTLSIILTYFIAIPIGVYSARNKDSKGDNILSTFLFMLYSLPNFWVATLLILVLSNYLGWFPVFGLGDIPENATAFQTLQIRAYHLILPLFCWTYPSLAFLSRQMRGGMLSTLGMDFIRTARAKGLEERTVVWKHSFKNSLLPIITLFANVFPRMVSGSIVVEVIFGIPGMGKTLLEAINNNDFPIVFAVVMLTALLTMIGYLVADILYGIVDPRIKYK